MTASSRRVAVMLELETGYGHHTGTYAGAQRFAQEQGWEMVIDEYVDDTLPERRTKTVPYAGIIARATRKLVTRASSLGVPVVNTWLNSLVREQLPGVFPDFSAMGRMRAEHLLARGLNRFAAIIANTEGQMRETKAFGDAITDAGGVLRVDTVPLVTARSLKSWRRTEQVIAEAMDDWELPIGVYVGSDSVGRLVAQMCRVRGLRVPGDVAIIAGLNEAAFCESPSPSITSFELGNERIGYEAARLLGRLMDGEEPPNEHILLPAEGIVVRESTDFFAVSDEVVAEALSFIAANAHRRIGPDAVAAAVSMETRTLQLRFRKYLDRPIATEIRRVRIERAKRELARTDRSMATIARDVGFGPPMRMYEVFRRELGVTPSEYRKQRQVKHQA